MSKKSKEQREYLLKLKKEITDFLVNYKKRYQLFPWSQVNKVSKIRLYSTTPVVVNGTKFTVKELVKNINSIKTKIKGKLKPSSYNYILRAYIKDSYKQSGSNLRNVYNTYHIELQSVFKELNQDLRFCLEGLREMNKSLKKESKQIKNINESAESKNDNFKLSSYMCKNINNDIINRYKDKYSFLKHVDLKDKSFVWFDDDNIVAILMIDEKDDGNIWITGIEVTKEYQRHGIGTEVLNYAIKKLKANALSVSKTNHTAINMYRKAGFKDDGKSHGKMYFMYLSSNKNINESVSSDEKETRRKVLEITLKILEDNGMGPKITKKKKDDWITKGNSGMFKGSLCIGGFKNEEQESLCNKVNKEIKSYGGKLTPDNYGTSFLCIKESEELTMTNDEILLAIIESEIDFDNDDIFEEDSIDSKEPEIVHNVFNPDLENLSEKACALRRMCDNSINKRNVTDARKFINIFDNFLHKEEKKFNTKFDKYDKKYPFSKFYNASHGLRYFYGEFKDTFKSYKNDLKKLKVELGKLEKKPVKESEEINMTQDELMLAIIESEINFDNDDIFEEGVNTEIRDEYKNFVKRYRNLVNDCKKSIRDNDFTEGRKKIKQIVTLIEHAKATTKSIEGGTGDAVLGMIISTLEATVKLFITQIVTFLVGMAMGTAAGAIGSKETGKDRIKDGLKSGLFVGGSSVITITVVRNIEFGLKKILDFCTIVKRAMNEDIKADIFNIYKNDIIQKYDIFKREVDKLGRELDKAEKKAEKKIEESEEISLYDEELMLAIIESMSDDEFDDDDVVEEGANLDSRKYFKFAKKEFKRLSKEYKKNIKNGEFKEARKKVTMMKAILTRTEKLLDEKEGGLGSVILGYVAEMMRIMLTTYAIMLPGSLGMVATTSGIMTGKTISTVIAKVSIPAYSIGYIVATINSVKEAITIIVGLINQFKNQKEVGVDDFNLYRNRLKTEIKRTLKITDKLNEHVDEVEKAYKEALKESKKADKAVKESAEFDKEKLAIYEACHNGHITVEEREQLLYNLENKKYINEADEEVEEGMSSYEKYGRVAKVLYERCAKGEITLEEREVLLLKAKDMILKEETENVYIDKDANEAKKELDKEIEGSED